MLNKKERAIMGIIYSKCSGDGSCLITVDEIALALPKKHKMSMGNIESVVRSLELDDYYDLVFSERKGKPVMCVNLHSKGLSYKREIVQLRRAIYTKLLLASISAVATFVFGRLLFFFFK